MENQEKMSLLGDQVHYNQRYKYYALVKDFISQKIEFGEFSWEFWEIYSENQQLIRNLPGDQEKWKTFFVTPKSRGFKAVITQIFWEVEDPESLDRMWENLNLDEEEIERLREQDIREYLQRIAREMEVFLNS